MLLIRMDITNFLSIKATLPLAMDPRVTVLLGSNDHGKSNVLKALLHLNDDLPITAEEANWDAEMPPSIDYTFELTEDEQVIWNQAIPKQEQSPPQSSNASRTLGDLQAEEGGTQTAASETAATPPTPEPLIKSITISRRGIGNPLEVNGAPLQKLPAAQSQLIAKSKPRVELFKTLSGNLQDSANPQTITAEEYEFMQGVFFYAGLDPLKSSSLFSQSDPSMRALDNASKKLDKNLRQLWGQGTDLSFELRHQAGTIEFLADDPAVKSRKARMSKRSDGVTQFFRVSMVLHARRMKNPSNRYIFLFDEPGVFLHPQGQRDLMQVFERLSIQSQIIYATHSLFMLNQNFPERHRLIYKDQDGTKVDQKPYRANWRLATDALGVHLTSNILFANKVLLVEGDSDPIYIYELLRQLNSLGEIDADSNALGIMSFYDYQNLRFLLQVFKREAQDSRVLVVVDGDAQGKTTVEKVRPLCERLDVPFYPLSKNYSIEDYCLLKDKFIEAAAKTIQIAAEAEGKQLQANLQDSVIKSYNEFKSAKDKKTLGSWFKDLSTQLLGDEASKVGLARTYAFLCRDVEKPSPTPQDLVEGKSLCQRIAGELKLPPVRARETIEVR